ncbi:hypothetical protein GQ53DRAFT_744886 [Thozetella sp. PMI_491]|nr:hypothetical protein GQ53DRAFT_744886 [Thozetella sp. PMI_491]
MPYNTTAIPPRKEATGQTQLPLTRVKKIVNVDKDIGICSNNAAFVITLATELFIQHLAQEGQNMAKVDRKPRRNIQYKDLANAVTHHDHLEFLEDTIPKAQPYKQIKEQAAARRARLQGLKGGDAGKLAGQQRPNGKKASLNGTAAETNGGTSSARASHTDSEDPSAQLELEMRQAQKAQGDDDDVEMTG